MPRRSMASPRNWASACRTSSSRPSRRRHYVSHVPMDHTAIIKFVENRFIGGSAHLTARDAAQPNLLDFFDFRTFHGPRRRHRPPRSHRVAGLQSVHPCEHGPLIHESQNLRSQTNRPASGRFVLCAMNRISAIASISALREYLSSLKLIRSTTNRARSLRRCHMQPQPSLTPR